MFASNGFNYGARTSTDSQSCHLLINDTMIIFGGMVESEQVSVLYTGGIYRIHTLAFQFQEGRCDYYNGTVYLCFDNTADKLCYQRLVSLEIYIIMFRNSRLFTVFLQLLI